MLISKSEKPGDRLGANSYVLVGRGKINSAPANVGNQRLHRFVASGLDRWLVCPMPRCCR